MPASSRNLSPAGSQLSAAARSARLRPMAMAVFNDDLFAEGTRHHAETSGDPATHSLQDRYREARSGLAAAQYHGKLAGKAYAARGPRWRVANEDKNRVVQALKL